MANEPRLTGRAERVTLAGKFIAIGPLDEPDAGGIDLYYSLGNVEFDVYMVADSEGMVDLLRRFGFDGIIHEDVLDAGAKYLEGEVPETVTTWRPFDQTQVKSATGNAGTFDSEDHRVDR